MAKKLVQVGEYNLYGHVESLGKVRLCGAERDSVLLCFRQAKVSEGGRVYKQADD